MLASSLDVFGCHSKTRAASNNPLIIEMGRHSNHHAAACDLQVDRLVQARAVMLQKHVETSDAKVCRAVLDIGRHVRGAYDDEPDIRIRGRDNEFSRRLGIVQRNDAGGLQKR